MNAIKVGKQRSQNEQEENGRCRQEDGQLYLHSNGSWTARQVRCSDLIPL